MQIRRCVGDLSDLTATHLLLLKRAELTALALTFPSLAEGNLALKLIRASPRRTERGCPCRLVVNTRPRGFGSPEAIHNPPLLASCGSPTR